MYYFYFKRNFILFYKFLFKYIFKNKFFFSINLSYFSIILFFLTKYFYIFYNISSNIKF